MVSLGWRASHASSETGYFVAEEISAEELRQQGRLLASEYTEFETLKSELSPDENLVQIFEMNGEEHVSVLCEEWQNDSRQFESIELVGYYALPGRLVCEVPKQLFYCIRALD